MLHTTSSDTRESIAASLGLRRVESVRIVVGGGRTRAEVTGVAHRHPHVSAISLASAHRLADAGVPLQIVHEGVGARRRPGGR